ncbi:hypothetical protein BU16DRAFT_397753 [Lophium mytilinum]|uniref:Transmembrane protein UsgS n=1 Tax=Lophium mytilinum TaxID=390894 RepID=A0A6A6QU56_9PEZI|nr:hypothetical protein BU16DRAFT_397753 [Lophium mytilinum]
MSNFDPNAILRGAQLTLVGAHRALQNPGLFTSDHYRQAAIAVAGGIAIRMIIAIPVIGVRILLWTLSFFINMDAVSWDNYVVDGLYFLEHSVLQVPFFLMSMMRYVTPTLDRMFMDSLQWVDQTYTQKHKSENPQSLRAIYGRRAGISLAIYALSFLPYVGRFVLPAASFYTFNNAVGLTPALVIFGSSVFLPKRYIVMFLQSYFSSRSLMRELLEPYFSRVRYTKEQKKQWFRDREGVLFGFGVGFFIFVKIPLVGVLIYGIAEASTAYLITKITEPPPPASQAEQFKERDVRWKNKHEFLNLPLSMLDAHNVAISEKEHFPAQKAMPRQEFS